MSAPATDGSDARQAGPAGEEHSFAVAVDGTRLFVRSKNGSHPPEAVCVFFCDGILCDGFIWKYLWEDLAPLAPLTHWHYRGHGRSALPVDPDRIDIDAHVDDLTAVRRHVGDPPCVIVGHSMGCQVALEAYHRDPSKIRGLILLCGTFGNVTSTFRGVPVLAHILPKLVDVALKKQELMRALWTRIPLDMAIKIAFRIGDIDPRHIHREDVLPYLQHMTHVDFPMFLRMLRAAGDHSAEGYLDRIAVPTLVVAGERDTFTPAFLAESMAEAIPGAELLMVPEGTHVVPIEQHQRIDERVLQFFRERILGLTALEGPSGATE